MTLKSRTHAPVVLVTLESSVLKAHTRLLVSSVVRVPLGSMAMDKRAHHGQQTVS